MKTMVLNSNMQVISEMKFPDRQICHVSSARIGEKSRDTYKGVAKVVNANELE